MHWNYYHMSTRQIKCLTITNHRCNTYAFNKTFSPRSLTMAKAKKYLIYYGGSNCFSSQKIYRPTQLQGYNQLACQPAGSAVMVGRKIVQNCRFFGHFWSGALWTAAKEGLFSKLLVRKLFLKVNDHRYPGIW